MFKHCTIKRLGNLGLRFKKWDYLIKRLRLTIIPLDTDPSGFGSKKPNSCWSYAPFKRKIYELGPYVQNTVPVSGSG